MGVRNAMATSTSTLGRPADRTRLIVQTLRNQIVEGELPPGGRLPTREEVERRFGAGASTVQKALEQLRRDGFVEVNGKQGTYVVPNPPHLTRDEFQNLVMFIRTGLLDRRAEPRNLCSQVPRTLPSGMEPLRFEECPH